MMIREWWDEGKREVALLELTIPFDTLLEEAALRKKGKVCRACGTHQKGWVQVQSDNNGSWINGLIN